MRARLAHGRNSAKSKVMKTSCNALAAALAILSTTALAQGVRTERQITLELASQIASATVAACQANGHHVTAAVVDRAGQLRALARADNAGPHTIDTSRAKAYTSASARNSTLTMMENAQKNPAAANLVQVPGFLLLGGGVPIRAGNDVIGAVGVGGAPGGHLDEQCALAALDKVKDALK
jgi:uncharacterized protein GlcG (DUF336 family)